MRKNDFVKARVNGELKQNVEGILSSLGLTMSEAINVYLSQIELIDIPPSLKEGDSC